MTKGNIPSWLKTSQFYSKKYGKYFRTWDSFVKFDNLAKKVYSYEKNKQWNGRKFTKLRHENMLKEFHKGIQRNKPVWRP